jgi:glycosyltransferase involved in cell wall biosynthesis
MKLPTLSVITPSYNSAEFLEDALLSVVGQQGPCVEHIVMDCASTDNTLEILNRFPHVQWISEPDKGQSDAINKGFLRATGDLMGWLNADDYYLLGGLQAIAHAAKQHPKADVIYGDCVFVDSTGKIVRSKVEHDFDPAILLYFGCYIPSTSTFIRRRVIDSGLLLDRDYRVCMDFEYFARLAHAGCKFHYVPRFIAAFRWHGCNVSLKQVDKRAQERRQVQRSFGEHQYSPSMLKFLANVHRTKRVLRKLVSGNIARELRVREMLGRDTRWQRGAEGFETCASLACL